VVISGFLVFSEDRAKGSAGAEIMLYLIIILSLMDSFEGHFVLRGFF
jgi:hypothetical protein